MNITLLCKVVDNYGDIGFVYRLSRSLSQISREELNLRIVVSDLISFSRMEPLVKTNLAFQKINVCNCEWEVYDWNAYDVCKEAFSRVAPEIILECFQCGRPDWLEEILFVPERKDIVHVVNVEYLTAEEYADDFHLLPSLTRSSSVKKVNFMPGFTSKTGGLVLDEPFVNYMHSEQSAKDALKNMFSACKIDVSSFDSYFNILVFSYEREYDSIVKALLRYETECKQKNPSFKIRVFAAAGLSLAPLKKACSKNNVRFEVVELPFLSQKEWDALVTLMNFSFVRGEDSLSRACLSGVPFVWHAYIQDDEYQIVKVNALLERMKPFFEEETFELLKEYWFLYNRTEGAVCGPEADTLLNELKKSSRTQNLGPKALNLLSEGVFTVNKEELLYKLLLRCDSLKRSFASFAVNLESNGNLAQKLLEYLKQCIA